MQLLFMKEILSALAIAITFAAYLPYIRSILRGKTRPHTFSWIIWGISTFIVFFAQLADHGGAGAWPIGISGVITLYVAWLAYKRRIDRSITRLDWWFLWLAVASLPLWFVTANPLAAVIILTFIDTIGFGPTFRKAYHFPYDEPVAFYAIMALRNAIAMAALEHFSWTTLLFPAVTGIGSLVFAVMVLLRRQQLTPSV